jgi:hypothetical protein
VDITNVLTMTGPTVVAGTGNALRLAPGSVLGDLTLSQTNRLDLTGNITVHDVVVTNGAALALSGVVTGASLTLGSGGVLSQTGAVIVGSALITSGGTLTGPRMAPLDLTVGGALVIANGGAVNANGLGYGANQGPGAGWAVSGSRGAPGGSYGGVGSGAWPTNVYGVFTNPVELGSGGGDNGYGDSAAGGAGGGAIRIRAQQLQNDGAIGADGMGGDWNMAQAGGGSGGSIAITVGQLSGSGSIHANGGWQVGGGGGGRVAMFYGDRSGFGGTVSALGGSSAGAGTVYWKKDSDSYGELVVDNGGTSSGGWSTPLSASAILRLNSFTVAGGARVSTAAGLRVATGDSAYFGGLISSNYLQVGSLWVSGQWVCGDTMELEAATVGGSPRIDFFTKPNQPYVIEVSTNLSLWTPILTNASTNGVFEWIETNTVQQRFFRSRQ